MRASFSPLCPLQPLLPPPPAQTLAYTLRSSVSAEQAQGKLSARERAAVESLAQEALSWLEGHADAEKEQIQEKQLAVEREAMPAMFKLKL